MSAAYEYPRFVRLVGGSLDGQKWDTARIPFFFGAAFIRTVEETYKLDAHEGDTFVYVYQPVAELRGGSDHEDATSPSGVKRSARYPGDN